MTLDWYDIIHDTGTSNEEGAVDIIMVCSLLLVKLSATTTGFIFPQASWNLT